MCLYRIKTIKKKKEEITQHVKGSKLFSLLKCNEISMIRNDFFQLIRVSTKKRTKNLCNIDAWLGALMQFSIFFFRVDTFINWINDTIISQVMWQCLPLFEFGFDVPPGFALQSGVPKGVLVDSRFVEVNIHWVSEEKQFSSCSNYPTDFFQKAFFILSIYTK